MFFFIYMISLRTKYAFKQDENRVNIFSWICVVRHHIFWYILRKKVYFQWCLVIFLFFLSVRILMWWSSFKRNNRTFMLLPMELVWGSQYLFPQTLKLMNNSAVHIHSFHRTLYHSIQSAYFLCTGCTVSQSYF